jgi:hypothetical protein
MSSGLLLTLTILVVPDQPNGQRDSVLTGEASVMFEARRDPLRGALPCILRDANGRENIGEIRASLCDEQPKRKCNYEDHEDGGVLMRTS